MNLRILRAINLLFFLGIGLSIKYVVGILLTPIEIQDILTAHNEYRATVNPPSNAMFQMIWHDDGALKANNMAQKCVSEHDTPADRATTKYPNGGGQNLFMTQATNPLNWTVVIKSWYFEVNSFKYGVDQNNFDSVGHYTQVVWGTTKEIGCARSSCPGQQIYVCNYYPPGNFPPYFIPYRKSVTQSCLGCIGNGTCVSSGQFAGKLLESCDLFCTDKYSNCPSLATQFCSYFMNDCALSCNSKCKA